MSKLENIAESIRKNKNIQEKAEISPIVQYIDYNSFKSTRIFSDTGEDSAAIKDNDKYIITDNVVKCRSRHKKTAFFKENIGTGRLVFYSIYMLQC